MCRLSGNELGVVLSRTLIIVGFILNSEWHRVFIYGVTLTLGCFCWDNTNFRNYIVNPFFSWIINDDNCWPWILNLSIYSDFFLNIWILIIFVKLFIETLENSPFLKSHWSWPSTFINPRKGGRRAVVTLLLTQSTLIKWFTNKQKD